MQATAARRTLCGRLTGGSQVAWPAGPGTALYEDKWYMLLLMVHMLLCMSVAGSPASPCSPLSATLLKRPHCSTMPTVSWWIHA
jgi:hypothetical protein